MFHHDDDNNADESTEDGQNQVDPTRESAQANDSYLPGQAGIPTPSSVAMQPGVSAQAVEPTWTDENEDVKPLGYLFVRYPAVEFGVFFLIEDDATIGRDESNAIQLNDPRVAANHGRIKRDAHPETGEDVFIIYDFGTTNGTQVNGQQVFGATVLRENDEVEIGSFTFVFKMLMR